MRVLIYGAGVIGSLYAVLLSEAGIDVTIYARGRRLEELQQRGLRYLDKSNVKRADVKVISTLEQNDIYSFIFLTVREEQVHKALEELKANQSPSIVTMVNTMEQYEKWENICGKNRIIPAFSGAGGSIDNGILNASLTPRIIQPTSFGEVDGSTTKRLKDLAQIFKKSRIPYQNIPNMHNWQISHLGMVVPIADAYYEAGNSPFVYKDKKKMDKTAKRMKSNFQQLSKRGVLSPFKFYLFVICPLPILSFALKQVFKSDFGNRFLYQHSIKAVDEMERLHNQFYTYLEGDK